MLMTTTTTIDHWAVIAKQRLALADDLDCLSESQWETPSLCSDWTVHELVGHLVVMHKTSMPKWLFLTAMARGNWDRANSKRSAREGARATSELVAELRHIAESRAIAPGFTSSAPLTDILIHSQDVRLPLGIASEQPTDAYRDVLDLLVTKKATGAFVPTQLPALRFVATDLDWSYGDGATVEGTAPDLALAMTGRTAKIAALSGAGQLTFAAWARS
jgi:uncharacterized protein (TIGR03083 family)